MNYLIVDNFAGGGLASVGIEQGLGRPVDIAINHDRVAVELHKMNHPHTRHYQSDVFEVDPVEATGGRPVLLAWFSPDCKHYSKARGGKPVEKRIRSLAWVVLRWASKLKERKPRVIILENVEEFQEWGPLVPKRKNGRVVYNDQGEPDMVPDPARKSRTFRQWCDNLRALGYAVEWRELRACDYGAPTIRKRLFVIARCDGHPIVWPEPTHGPGRLPYRTAAECLDFSLDCPSIFERPRPLAENTLRRIARGIQRYVIEDPEPFVIPTTHAGDSRVHGIHEPLRTVTGAQRGEYALCAPFLSRIGQTGGNGGYFNDARAPLTTVVSKAEHTLVTAFLSTYYGRDEFRGSQLDEPLRTQSTENRFALCTSHLLKLKGTCRHGQRTDAPAPTVQAGGNHIGEVRAFLIKYYSGGTGKTGWPLTRPAPTVTAKHRLGLVTVHGNLYQLADIGMRMIQPPELFACQDAPPGYIIDRLPDGTRLTKTAQVKLCGNAVPPAFSRALTRANVTAFYGEQREAGDV